MNTSLLTLFFTVMTRINLLGFAWINAFFDAVKTSRDKCAHRQIRITAMVCTLQLNIHRIGLALKEKRRHTNGTFAVIEAVSVIRGTPEMREQATIGIGASTRNGKEATNMSQHASDEIFAKLTEATLFMSVVKKVRIGMLALFGSPETKVKMGS